MGRAFSLIGILIVVGAGMWIYTREAQTATSVGSNPQTTVDVIGVKNDLMAIANAEKRYWATNSRYASLDELRQNGDIHIPTRSHFTYSADATENAFTISASYSGPDPDAPRRISVNDTMQMSTE